jgi:hypothetical protein
MKTTKIVALLFGVLLASFSQSFGQANLQFTAVAQTDEQAIRLTWTSTNSEIYEIDEADALAGNADGTTAWNKLYDNYPSQGTNTFWLDTGNYNLAPQILHPKNMPMRFYRIVDKGADTTSDEPSVVITSPSSNTAVSDELTVTVIATTDQPVLSGTKLYVDGQEMLPAINTTNYTDGSGVTNYEVDTYNLNTCEWGNETHTLFATAESESGNGDAIGSPPVATGHGVSPFVPVLFSNLVTKISFSQPSFDPSSGQTQHVSAVFAANCNWTLTVRDIFSNAVHTATGSGSSLQHDWNGTSDGGTNLPAGVYYYYISAQTNGQAYMSMEGSGSSMLSSASALSAASVEPTELWALPPDSSAPPLPLAIYPPGFNTNGFTIFEATSSEVQALTKAVLAEDKPVAKAKASMLASSDSSGGSFSPDAAGGGSSAGSQNPPASPQRPPSNPIVGISGLFGIAYDTFTANGTNVMSAPFIPNIPGINGSYIALDSFSGNTHCTYSPVPQFNAQANNFMSEMQLYGWKNTIHKVDDQLNINDLRGSGTPFNNVSLGIFMSHGAYGTTQDYLAGLCKQMYFPVTSGGSIQYLRMSEMSLGGSDPTNGLKWFVFYACDSLHQANWNSMRNAGKQPYNGNMHLIIGANSVISTSSTILQKWAQYMNFGRTAGGANPMKIKDAWYQAAADAYRGHTYTNTMVMAVAGDSACMDDYSEQGFNSAPQGTWSYTSLQVWP